MKLCIEFILFHEQPDGSTILFSWQIVGRPLEKKNEANTDQAQRREDQGMAEEVETKISHEPARIVITGLKADQEIGIVKIDKAHRQESKTEGVVARR